MDFSSLTEGITPYSIALQVTTALAGPLRIRLSSTRPSLAVQAVGFSAAAADFFLKAEGDPSLSHIHMLFDVANGVSMSIIALRSVAACSLTFMKHDMKKWRKAFSIASVSLCAATLVGVQMFAADFIAAGKMLFQVSGAGFGARADFEETQAMRRRYFAGMFASSLIYATSVKSWGLDINSAVNLGYTVHHLRNDEKYGYKLQRRLKFVALTGTFWNNAEIRRDTAKDMVRPVQQAAKFSGMLITDRQTQIQTALTLGRPIKRLGQKIWHWPTK